MGDVMTSLETQSGQSDAYPVAYEPPELTAIGTIEELTLVETDAVTSAKSYTT